MIKLQSVWNTPTPKFVTMILEPYNSITRSDLESSCMQEIKGSQWFFLSIKIKKNFYMRGIHTTNFTTNLVIQFFS